MARGGAAAKPVPPEKDYPAEDQAFLIVYLKEIVKYAEKQKLNKTYKNLIRADVGDPDLVPHFVNSLFNQKKTNRFSNANSALLSSLGVKIKIYKVVELPDNATEDDLKRTGLIKLEKAKEDRKTYSFLFPFENSLSNEYLGELLSKEFGKSFGAGITSLSINDATALEGTSNTTSELNITVSTIDSMFKEHLVASEEDPNVLTKVRILDLIHMTNAKVKKPSKGPVELVDHLFRLKFVIGWNYDLKTLKRINFGSKELTQSDIEDLKSALSKCFATYYCISRDFSLELQETGRINLKLQYTSHNQILNSKEVDALYKIVDGFAVNEQTLLEQNFKREEYIKKLEEIKGKKVAGAESEAEAVKKAADAEIEKLKKALHQDRFSMHKNFFKNLLENAKIYQLKVPTNSIGTMRAALNPANGDFKRRSAGFNLYVEKASGHHQVINLAERYSPGVKEAFIDVSKYTKDFNKEKVDEYSKQIQTEEGPTKTHIEGGHRAINFVFLGDILEYMFGALKVKKSIEFRNIIPIVGCFCTADPQKPTPLKTDEKDARKEELSFEALLERTTSYNFCDLPISIQRLKKFMFDTIVARELSHITLDTFLTEFFKECVSKTLDASLFGSNIRRVFGNIMFGESNLRTYTEGDTQYEFFSKKDIKQVWERAIDLPPIEVKPDLEPPLFDQEGHAENYIVNYMYITTRLLDQVAGKVLNFSDRDAYGIIDLHIGRDRGIVKNISFQKSNIKYLAESAFLDQRQRKDTRVNPLMLKGVMNAEIEMIGNPFFKANNSVYINPSFLFKNPGLVDQEVIDYGLGGYYSVTKVIHEVSPDKFTSKVSARFNHFGNGKKIDAKENPEEPPSAKDDLITQINEIGAQAAASSRETTGGV